MPTCCAGSPIPSRTSRRSRPRKPWLSWIDSRPSWRGRGATGTRLQLAGEVERRLSARTLPAERELIANMVRVLEVTASLTAPQRSAIQRCLALMCYGMPRFQRAASLARPAAQHRSRRLLLLRRRRGRGYAHGAFLRVRSSHSPKSRKDAIPGGFLRARSANDQHPERCLGRSQPGRLLVAAGGIHPARRRPGAARPGAPESRVSTPECAS